MTSAKRDANDIAAERGPDGLAHYLAAAEQLVDIEERRKVGLFIPCSGSDLYHGDTYAPPIIHGILRENEIMTLIAPAKAGKSQLLISLAYAIATGACWLRPEWRCERGRVLYIDNELEPRTLNARRKRVREHLGLSPEADNQIAQWNLWGISEPEGLLAYIRKHLHLAKEFKPSTVFLDSLYFSLPPGANENSTADMADVYRQLYTILRELGRCCMIVNHHSSKGNQAEKDITDVGRGSGAIVGATGTHMILRAHEQDNCYTAEAVCRSWPQPQPLVLRRVTASNEAVLWESTEHDPERLKGKRQRSPCKAAPSEGLDDAAFATYLPDEGAWLAPRRVADVIKAREGYTRDESRNLVQAVILRHQLDELTIEDGEKNCGEFIAMISFGKGGGLKMRRKPYVAPEGGGR